MKKILLFLAIAFSFTLSAQYIHIQEDFNNSTLPAGWTTTAVTGSTAWSFGIDGALNIAGNNNLDGTALAYFDDDVLGVGQTNNTAQLVTPTFDNSAYSITILEFDYNFRDLSRPSVTDSFSVQVFDGLNWITVFSVITNDCGNYVGACVGNFPKATIDISAYSNANCQLRFTYFDGNDWSWHVGVDNVTVYSLYGQDIGVSEIVNLTNRCLSNQQRIQVKVKNFGLDTISNFVVTCNVDSGTQILQDTLSAQLLPFDSIIYTFNGFVNLGMAGNTYDIHSYTTLLLDSGRHNDSTYLQVFNSQRQAPFFDDFEGNNNWVFDGTNSTWAVDTPSAVVLNSAFSGIKALGTNPLGNYMNNELSYAISTCFILDSDSLTAPIIEFKHNYDFGASIDGLEIEYSDSESNWNKLDAGVFASNWYDTNSYWKGNSSGWVTSRTVLSNLKSQENIKFRFKFQSDNSITRDGALIDDFFIRVSDSVDIALQLVENPTTEELNRCSSGFENIIVVAANEGYLPIDSIFFFYQVNGGQIYQDTAIRILPAFSKATFEIQPIYNFSAVSQYTIDVWAKVKGDSRPSNDSLLGYSVQKSVNKTAIKLGFEEDFSTFFDNSCNGVPAASIGDTLRDEWSELSAGLFRWHVQDGNVCNGTASLRTGPDTDHSGDGMFMFTEASQIAGSSNALLDALLETPCVDIGSYVNPTLRFWYHRYGADLGNLYIDVFANGLWDLAVDSLIGQSQSSSMDSWSRKNIDLSQFSNQIVTVRFRAKFGGGFEGDMAIDDVAFYSAISKDAKMDDLRIQTPPCNSDSAAINFVVNNFGSDSIGLNQLKVKYQVNGGFVQTDSNLLSIRSDSSFLFTGMVYGLSPSKNVITAWVELPADSNQYNDTLHIFYTPDYDTLNYTEGFENIVPSNGFCGNYNPQLNLGWQVDVNDQWVAGHDIICSYGISGATPTSSTGPDSAYAGHGFMYFEPGFNSVLDTANLTSGCFDLRNDSLSYLDFYYHMYGAGTGKLYVDVLANGVATRLDSIVGQQHFSATDPWSLKTINLNQFAGDIIRIRFTAMESTNTSISDQGAISIDNVRISNSFPVSIKEVATSNSFQLFPNPTNGEFILRGNGFSTSEHSISVMDLNGRVIESRIVNANSNSINERFDLSNQANGVYFISIQSEGKVEVKKVVLTGR